MKNDFRKRLIRFLISIALALGFYFAVGGLTASGAVNRYYAKIINLVLVYVVAAVSLNFSCGFLGQLPLGHAGFMAVGAYTAALITRSHTLPGILGLSPEMVTFFFATVAGGVLAAVFGILIGLPALRLHGDYLAIITMGFGEIIRVIIQNLKFTGGAMGLNGIPKYTTFGSAYFWVVVTILFSFLLINSRHGRAILSVREDEIAAESCGIDTTFYKTFTFAAAAFFGGVAGSLLAHHVSYVEPGNFGFSQSIEILVMVVLGGLGSVAGSVIAAAVLTVLPELLYAFSDWRMVIYSVLLVLVMIFRPTGLMGGFDETAASVRKKLRKLRERRKEENA